MAKWLATAWMYHILFIYTNAAHLCIYVSWLTFGDIMNNDAKNIYVQMLYGYVFSWAYTKEYNC